MPKVTVLPNTSVYESFQQYSHDKYLGSPGNDRLRLIVGVMHDTLPCAPTLTEYFERKYAKLYKLIPND